MFDRAMLSMFAATVIAQLGLGFYRARLLQGSARPAVALAALFSLIALLWYARRRELYGGFLARPAALLLATIGVVSGLSAFNAPFLGFLGAFSVPLFALSAAALLMVAELSARIQVVPAILFIIAVAMLEMALTSDARWEGRIGSLFSPTSQEAIIETLWSGGSRPDIALIVFPGRSRPSQRRS